MLSIYIVGDVFAPAAKLENTMYCYSEFLNEKANIISSRSKIILGQGLSTEQVLFLQRLTPNDRLELPSYERVCLKEWVHKKNEKNVLILKPTRVDSIYYSGLFIHPENELLQDHLTSVHLPWMLVTEAARQMTQAIYNLFFTRQRIALTTAVTSKFYHPVFPIQCEIQSTLDFKQDVDEDYFVFDISFIQSEMVCAKLILKSIFFDKEMHEKKEAAAIHRCLLNRNNGFC